MSDVLCVSGWGFKSEVMRDLQTPGLSFCFWNYPKAVSFDCLAENLVQACHPETTVVAWSFGGLLALRAHQLFPGAFKRLVLIASQPYLCEDTAWQGMSRISLHKFTVLIARDFNRAIKKFISWCAYPHGTELSHLLLAEAVASELVFLLDMLERDLRQYYRGLTMPILHLLGSEDLVMPQNVEQLRRLNSSLDCHVIAGAGHVPFLSHPSEVQSAIRRFAYASTNV